MISSCYCEATCGTSWRYSCQCWCHGNDMDKLWDVNNWTDRDLKYEAWSKEREGYPSNTKGE